MGGTEKEIGDLGLGNGYLDLEGMERMNQNPKTANAEVGSSLRVSDDSANLTSRDIEELESNGLYVVGNPGSANGKLQKSNGLVIATAAEPIAAAPHQKETSTPELTSAAASKTS